MGSKTRTSEGLAGVAVYLTFDSWALDFMIRHHRVPKWDITYTQACKFRLVRMWYFVYARFMFSAGSRRRRAILA